MDEYFKDPLSFVLSHSLPPPHYLPSKPFVGALFDILKDSGCQGIGSIGSGSGITEWLLCHVALANGVMLKVLLVDLVDVQHVPFEGLEADVSYGLIADQHFPSFIHVPSVFALAFLWGTQAPWKSYVEEYERKEGKCIVMSGDATCCPNPNAKKSKDIEWLVERGWKVKVHEKFENMTHLTSLSFGLE
eukprot:TRINITY_DN24866_c0_g1_i1.p1 TRINITY_DN24866_c0_g1~~TRINITY_DN24866_c0_g1_i1.p1  ORF type:complete len:189 (+),score=57.07 TRINITY_DN24866_c0_g1_i1:88-654(+)